MVSFCPGKASTTWPRIRKAGCFAVNILGRHHSDVCRAFTTKDPGCTDVLAGARRNVTGAPLLADALGWIECDIAAVFDAGDHELVLGAVLDLDLREESAPLVFYGGKFMELSERSGENRR
jgi:3-hydroxy-9,10-secoandrosta-1,3,5(10)-triene-9,17-dione monooxygenase reductase component